MEKPDLSKQVRRKELAQPPVHAALAEPTSRYAQTAASKDGDGIGGDELAWREPREKTADVERRRRLAAMAWCVRRGSAGDGGLCVDGGRARVWLFLSSSWGLRKKHVGVDKEGGRRTCRPSPGSPTSVVWIILFALDYSSF
jgi:hypothetical protein